MPVGLEGERQSLCIVLLLHHSGLAGLNWLWWGQERAAPVSHPATAFLSSSLSMCTRSQASMETHKESNSCELPRNSGPHRATTCPQVFCRPQSEGLQMLVEVVG